MTSPAPTPFVPEEYVADDLVEQLHTFHHAGTDDFDFSNADYRTSVGGFWVATVMIGMLFMIFMWFFSCCSKCACFREKCSCCFGHCYGKLGNCVLAGLFILALVVLMGSYFARGQFLEAAEEVGVQVGVMKGIFQELDTAVDEFVTQDESYSYWIDQATCDPLSLYDDVVISYMSDDQLAEINAIDPQTELSTYLTVFSDAVTMMVDFELADMVEQLETGQVFIESSLPDYITIGIGLVTAMFGVIAILGVVSSFTTCKYDDCLLVFIGSFTLMLTIVLVGLEIATSVAIADFCYADPAEATLSLAEYSGLAGGSLDLVEFFTTCEGENPFYPFLANVTTGFQMLNATAISVGNQGICDDTSMTKIAAESIASQTTLADIGTSVMCGRMNQIFTALFHEVFCDNFLWGVYMCWVVHISAGFLIWAAFIGFPCAKEAPVEGGAKTHASSDEGVEMK